MDEECSATVLNGETGGIVANSSLARRKHISSDKTLYARQIAVGMSFRQSQTPLRDFRMTVSVRCIFWIFMTLGRHEFFGSQPSSS